MLVGLALPLSALLRGEPGEPLELDRRERVVALWTNSAFLWVTAGAVGLAWWWADRPRAALGLTAPSGGHGLTLAISAALLAVYALDTWVKMRTPAGRARARERILRQIPFLPRQRDELPHLFALSASAGVCEEIVFRGFLVSYVASYTGSGPTGVFVAVAAPALVFGLAHCYQGWKAAALVACMAVAFGATFVVSGSLLVPIVLHTAVDLIGGLLGMRLYGNATQH